MNIISIVNNDKRIFYIIKPAYKPDSIIILTKYNGFTKIIECSSKCDDCCPNLRIDKIYLTNYDIKISMNVNILKNIFLELNNYTKVMLIKNKKIIFQIENIKIILDETKYLLEGKEKDYVYTFNQKLIEYIKQLQVDSKAHIEILFKNKDNQIIIKDENIVYIDQTNFNRIFN